MADSELVKSLVALGGVPLILGFVQLFKPFISDTRYYPLLAVAMGLVINLVASWALGVSTMSDWVAALFNGIIAGMAASGVYSTGSTLREGPAADKNNRSSEGETDETK
ncbi:MAG: hypothetical protein LLF82_000089 [Dehalococcoides mccartyi]|uniref:hypothetical protein n=1 Tax=Dehalococcoides mccartyi TaxID=61435 RepID=UPI00242F90B6|nr:hypothetical protein [Dehalococcoides mccartyi]MCF7634625.1 hypothetical protein [Dehalococcoides mccartyi]